MLFYSGNKLDLIPLHLLEANRDGRVEPRVPGVLRVGHVVSRNTSLCPRHCHTTLQRRKLEGVRDMSRFLGTSGPGESLSGDIYHEIADQEGV